MKTFLLLAFSLTTALAQVANAEDQTRVVKAPNRNTKRQCGEIALQTPGCGSQLSRIA